MTTAPGSASRMRSSSRRHSATSGGSDAPRSSWARRAMTASAPRSPSSSLVATSTPGQASNPATQSGGPATRTRAPSVSRQWMFERATREWTTSPTIVSSTPSSVPSASRSVRASSSAWVGMGVAAVAGVDDPQAGGASRQVRRPRRPVAQDERRHPGPLERAQRVDQRLALDDAAAGHRQVHRRRAQRLGRQLEADPGAGRGLVEGQANHLGLEHGPMPPLGARRAHLNRQCPGSARSRRA